MLATMLTLLPIFTSSMVINRITTTDDRELTYVSLAGGADIYISGVGLGTPFRPPTIFVGPTTCDVQSFTSSNTRIHCVLNGDLLPPPPDAYATSTTNPSYASGDAMSKAGDFRMLKLYAVPYGVTARQLREGGRHADCWHVGGTNHDCFVRVDASGTPRLERVLTPALQPGGLLRVAGQGVDGGLRGEAKVKARLVQAGGGQSIGCNSRYADDPTNALAHSDATSFSCRLDASAASLSGFFDLKLKVLANDRGDAYAAQATSKQLDVAGGATFDAEVLPRIASVAPRSGSAAGGTDLTVAGSGFGSNKTAIRVVVGGAHCAVTELSERSLTCRIEPLSADAPAAAARLESAPGERGLRWRHGEGDGGDVVVDAFATPAWAPSPTQPSTIDGWFESPCDCDVTFTVRGGGADATLRWSGGEGAAASEVLAAVSGGGPASAEWPAWPLAAAGWRAAAVSRKVSLTAGGRYFLRSRAPPAPAAARSARACTHRSRRRR